MKRLSLFVASVGLAVVGAHAATRLDASSAEIVLAKGTSRTIAYAAQEMKTILGDVLGSEIPVVTAPTAGKTSIFLGDSSWSRAAGISTNDLVRDAFVTKIVNGQVFLVGRDDATTDINHLFEKGLDWGVSHTEHATVFAVYGFLEDFAGCRFYFPGPLGTVVPKATALELPDTARTNAPVFTVRDIYLRYARAGRPDEPTETKAQNLFRRRANAQDWLRLRLQTESIPCCHGEGAFAIHERFAQSHPEYFMLGKDRATKEMRRDTDPARKLSYHPNQLCHTSKVWDEFYEDVKAYLTGQSAKVRGIPSRWDAKKFGWNGNCVGGKYVDIMPQDGFTACQCENCQKAYTKEMHYATDLVWGNTVKLAKRLKAEGVKGYVTQMAYTPYARVPDVAIPDNVLVMVARTGPWNVRSDKLFQKELGDYRAWAEKCGHKVWVWTYPHKYGPTAVPGLPSVAPRAWGTYFQAAAPWIFGSFTECETESAIYNYLNYYVFSKLAWDTQLDINALLDDHYAKMFGPAAAEMKQFFEALEDAWMEVVGTVVDTDLGPVTTPPSEYDQATRVYSPAKLAAWAALLDAAEKKAAADALVCARVQFFRAQYLAPLAKLMGDYLESISVEKALARRAASPAPQNLVNPKRWAPYPSKGGVPLIDESLTGPSGGHPLHIRDIGGKLYLSNLLDKAPYTLKPNTRYRLSCFIKTKDIVPQAKQGGVYMEMNNGGKNWAESNKTRISGTMDWIYHEMEFSTIETLIPHPFFVLRIINATGEAWFDGVVLEELGS